MGIAIRVEFLLPANTVAEQSAAREAEIAIRDHFGGATATSRETPVFHGYWFSSTGVWIDDALVLVVADSERDQVIIAMDIFDLHARLAELYEAARSPQEAFWIVQTPIDVYSPA